eukprot:SAG11_NODE_419_length_9648_cov_6.815478_3_plen_89_part_00
MTLYEELMEHQISFVTADMSAEEAAASRADQNNKRKQCEEDARIARELTAKETKKQKKKQKKDEKQVADDNAADPTQLAQRSRAARRL